MSAIISTGQWQRRKRDSRRRVIEHAARVYCLAGLIMA